MKRLAARILSHLANFAAFTAAEFAVLFGLPALAERHPFILLAVSIAILILVIIANFKAAKETDQALQAHHRFPH